MFNLVNGYLNGRYLFYFSPVYDISWLSDPGFIIGFLIFVFGYIINIWSDKILRGSRKLAIQKATISNGDSGRNLIGSIKNIVFNYKIPKVHSLNLYQAQIILKKF